MRSKHPLLGYLYIAAATFCWGASATLGKAVFTGKLSFRGEVVPSLTPTALAQSRVTFSLLILAMLLLAWKGRAGLTMDHKDALRCMLLGLGGLVGSNFFYYYAIEKTSVATAIILQYIAPVWVLLYMASRGLQRATAQRVIAVVLAVLGSALAIGAISVNGHAPFFHIAGLKLNLLGVMAAELAAISFAFYNIYGHGLLEHHARSKVLAYALLGASLFWVVVNPPWKIAAAHYTPLQWWFMLGFAISSMLLPFSFYFSGLQHLDATRAIVTSCLEPVFAIVMAAMFVSEPVGGIQIIGIALVLAATVLIQLPERGEEVHPAEPVV